MGYSGLCSGPFVWLDELVWETLLGCLDLIALCLMWSIWRERNSCIF
jgi:hypothetical protein